MPGLNDERRMAHQCRTLKRILTAREHGADLVLANTRCVHVARIDPEIVPYDKSIRVHNTALFPRDMLFDLSVKDRRKHRILQDYVKPCKAYGNWCVSAWTKLASSWRNAASPRRGSKSHTVRSAPRGAQKRRLDQHIPLAVRDQRPGHVASLEAELCRRTRAAGQSHWPGSGQKSRIVSP
jgi:hypothetical protein